MYAVRTAYCVKWRRHHGKKFNWLINRNTSKFTSFIGYEYTGTPGTSNYHRNVILGTALCNEPISYIDAIDIALVLLKLSSDSDCDYITIPHNTNLANGRMAPYMKI